MQNSTQLPPPTPTWTEAPFELQRGGAVLHGASTGQGPAVLFLHAGREHRQVWGPVIDELLRCVSAKCVTVDQRGHGASSGVVTGLQPFADDAAAIVDWIGEPTVVVGSSLGGMAAVAAVAEKAARSSIIGLVLVDIVPDPEPAPVWMFLEQAGLLPDAKSLAEDILSRRETLRSSLMGFEGRVMLIRGELSAITDTDVERLSAYRPDAVVTTVAKAGHLIARDRPAELGQLLARTVPDWFSLRPD